MAISKYKQLLRQCPICKNDVGEVLHHQQFSLPDKHCLPAAYDVVACHQCGFVYADTSAQQVDYNHYYREFSKYENTSLSTGGGTTESDAKRIEQTVADIANLLTDKNAAILDIGCANGGLLAALKLKGYHNVTGLDPSPACIEHVTKQGIRAFVGGLFHYNSLDTTSWEQQFDCIILSHVLEHVYALQEAVTEIISRLRTGGILYIEVPDASRYHAYYIVPYYYFDCEHINHFDEHVLKNLFLTFGCTYITHAKKEIAVAGNKQYPAVYAVFRKRESKDIHYTIVYHDTIITSVQDHVKQSRKANAYQVFNELAKSQQPIVIWGAGSHALRLLKSTNLGKCNIVAFVDKDQKKQGTQIGAVAVYDPSFLYTFTGTVVVCAALYNDEIVEEMKNMRLSCAIVTAN